MTRLFAALAIAVVAGGCSKNHADPAAAESKELAEEAATVSGLVKDGSYGTAIFSILNVGKTEDGAERPDANHRISTVAAFAAPAILHSWDAIAAYQTGLVTKRGTDRARGLDAGNCFDCEDLPRLMAIAGPTVPALKAKWDALAPELAKAEAAAYDAEANDKRPQVFVLAKEDYDVMALDCVRDALAKRFPDYKFVSTGHVEGPTVHVTATIAKADYRNTATQEQTSVMSGLKIELTGEGLVPALAKQLVLPIAAVANVDTPDEIRGSVPGTAPTLEASRVGIEKIQLLVADVCGQLAETIDKLGKR